MSDELTLRDRFAMHALAMFEVNLRPGFENEREDRRGKQEHARTIAELIYIVADAMLDARAAKEKDVPEAAARGAGPSHAGASPAGEARK